MRPISLIVEAGRTAAAQRITSILVMLLCAGICAVTLLTVGGTAAAEKQVLNHIDSAGSRLLIVTDKNDAGLITPEAVEVLSELNTVERVMGIDRPFDVTNQAIGDGGPKIAAWRVIGAIPSAATLTLGRWPQPGEALISTSGQRALGLVLPSGAIADAASHEYPVVGAFTARPPFEFLNNGAIIRATNDASVTTNAVYVVITSVNAVRPTEHTVIAALGPTDLNTINIKSPTALANLQQFIAGDLGVFSRNLLIVVMAAGGFLLATVILAEVLLRRRDLGRRRALGASRSTLIVLIVARTTIPAVLGSAAGLLVGILAAIRWGHVPPWDFVVGTGILAVITAAFAAAAPAILAAWRDPVAVLRTP
jgi:putative ABC transport system permease protein